MVAINLYLLLGLLQALLVVVVVLAIWIWRQRRTARRLQRAETQIAHLQARPTARDYLQSEQEAQRRQPAADDDSGRWAEVRAAYLQFELERASAEAGAAPPDLDALRTHLEGLLSPPVLSETSEDTRPPVEVDEENIDFPEMLQRQRQLLDALKAQVHGAVSNTLDLQRSDEKFELLELVGREMESCTLMMEEENNFLRDQIRALLESPDPSADETESKP